MSIEDDAIAILGLVRQQQAAIDAAAAALTKATASLSGDYSKIVKAIAGIESMPKTVAEASKTGAEEGAAVGVKNSLTTESEALKVAINAAVKEIRKIKRPTLIERGLYSAGGGLVGASLAVAVFVGFIKFDMLTIRVSATFDAKKVADQIIEKLPKKR